MTDQQVGTFLYNYGFPTYVDICNKLPELLGVREELVAILQGRAASKGIGRESTYIVLTNKRLLFLHFPVFGSAKVVERQLDEIESTFYKKGILSGELVILWAISNGGTDFTHCDNKLGQKFSDICNEFLKNRLSEPIHQPVKEQKEQTAQQSTQSLADKLRELAKLRDEGILTEEEFTQQKEKLLNKFG